MAQTNINISMDSDTKQKFDDLCSEIGLTINTAFNIFAKTVIRERRIPFELTAEQPNYETLEAINEFYEMQAHPEKYKRYHSFKDAVKEVSEDATYYTF